MIITASRRIEFDMAHRVRGHENKCKYVHGHRYILEVTFEAQQLDSIGRVIDFGIVKQILGTWIDDNLDHNVILDQKDKELGVQIEKFTGQKIYYLDNNPTVENIAKHLYEDILPTLFIGGDITFHSLKLYETPNCYSIVSNRH
jgi:6-pyruvoyltetrahydropterin/6-carboxytetrahydropterin synthase